MNGGEEAEEGSGFEVSGLGTEWSIEELRWRG